jgi:hypothetical protein
MTCRQFEQQWDDLLDARGGVPTHLEAGLEAHASACPQCRAVSNRYQLLLQAMAGLRTPTPSPASVDRLHALTVPAGRPTLVIGTRRRRMLAGALATAATFALAWLGGGDRFDREPAQPVPTIVPRLAPPARPLGLALADATEATLDLARETSAPASRIGREFLELGREPSTPSDTPTEGSQRAEPGNEEEAGDSAGSGLFRAVGAGVKPLSGSARHAFSFLLGPPDETPDVPATGGRDGL